MGRSRWERKGGKSIPGSVSSMCKGPEITKSTYSTQ